METPENRAKYLVKLIEQAKDVEDADYCYAEGDMGEDEYHILRLYPVAGEHFGLPSARKVLSWLDPAWEPYNENERAEHEAIHELRALLQAACDPLDLWQASEGGNTFGGTQSVFLARLAEENEIRDWKAEHAIE